MYIYSYIYIQMGHIQLLQENDIDWENENSLRRYIYTYMTIWAQTWVNVFTCSNCSLGVMALAKFLNGLLSCSWICFCQFMLLYQYLIAYYLNLRILVLASNSSDNVGPVQWQCWSCTVTHAYKWLFLVKGIMYTSRFNKNV